MALAKVKRWVLEPVWTAAPAPKREAWTCPACGREVWRDSPAWKGIWFAPTPVELVTRCARQHAAHGRDGEALRSADEARWAPVIGLDEQAGLEDPSSRRVPVVGLEGGGFLALLPPSGVRFLEVDDGALEVDVLDDLQPSDLVGRGARTGPSLGRVAAQDVPVHDGSVDARQLRAALSRRAG